MEKKLGTAVRREAQVRTSSSRTALCLSVQRGTWNENTMLNIISSLLGTPPDALALTDTSVISRFSFISVGSFPIVPFELYNCTPTPEISQSHMSTHTASYSCGWLRCLTLNRKTLSLSHSPLI